MIKYGLQIIFIYLSLSLKGQVHLTLTQCEDAFRKNNYLLLAEQLNINIAEANIIQAKIWDLPYALGEFNSINPQEGKIFSVGSKGQKAVAISQLIYLGGKKKAEVEFAKSTLPIAQLTLEQLVRNLRFRITENYYSLYFDNLKIANLNNKIANIDSLVASYAVQSQKGNIPLKDVVRLQSLSLNLKNQFADIQKNIFTAQEALKILTGVAEDIIPTLNDNELNTVLSKPTTYQVADLQAIALEKNPDLLIFNKIIESKELFHKWQQTLAKPDLTVGAGYDQRGGAFQNQINLTVGIPIALWNRNRGNIQMAALEINQSKNLKSQKELELKTNIETAVKEFLFQKNLYQKVTTESIQNFDVVYAGVIQNFQKHNISLIEFTDIIESYIESTVLLNDIKKAVLVSGANLNYLVNEKVF